MLSCKVMEILWNLVIHKAKVTKIQLARRQYGELPPMISL